MRGGLKAQQKDPSGLALSLGSTGWIKHEEPAATGVKAAGSGLAGVRVGGQAEPLPGPHVRDREPRPEGTHWSG